MAEAVIAWYSWLSGLTQGPILLIQDWIEGSSAPLVSALLFGQPLRQVRTAIDAKYGSKGPATPTPMPPR
jgi:hypothetical protein